MKQRSVYLDLIRIVACFMVIMMHSPKPLSEGLYSPMLGIVSYLSTPCNGLFFMASGALLFGGGLPFGAFMKKRLGRIVCPTVAWSLFYILLNTLQQGGGICELANQLAWIPFYRTDACGYLWFMYALLGCYFLVPIIEPWLMKVTRKELEIILGLWLVVSIIPLITVYLNVGGIDESSSWYYFSGFFGYFLLGWYASKYSIRWKQVGIAAMISVVFMGIRYKQSKLPVDINCYLHPYVIMYCFVIFVSIKKLFYGYNKHCNIIATLSGCTFGVYLIHSLLLNTWLKHSDTICALPIELGIFARWAITVIVGFSIILVLRKIPGHKYLIG